MTDELKAALADLSAETADTELRDRVLAGARRRRSRRRLAGGAAVTCLVIVAIVGATIGLGPIPGDLDRQIETPAAGSGTMFFTRESAAGQELLRRRPSGAIETVTVLDSDTVTGVSVSPSGRYASWQEHERSAGGEPVEYGLPPGDAASKVWVLDMRTGERSVVGEYSADARLCRSPSWAPDTEPRLLVHNPHSGSGSVMWVDVESGETSISYRMRTERRRGSCPVFAATEVGGGYRLFTMDDPESGEVRTMDPRRGTDVIPVGRDDEGSLGEISGLAAVSPNGERLCLQRTNTSSPAWSGQPSCDVMVETETGQATPRNQTDWAHAQWLADGTLVWRWGDGSIRLESAEGRVLDEFTVEVELNQADLLTVVP